MALGFPSGAKSLCVKAPDAIKFSSDTVFIGNFLRGYFDTDGCLSFDKKIYNSNIFKKTKNFYPRLLFSTVSFNLFGDVCHMFERLGLRFSTSTYKPKVPSENRKYTIQMAGITQLNNWLLLIGMRNPTKYSRYLIWKKHGHCPPNTTFEERVNVLKGQISISDVEPIA
tara:strand:- start:718 stop:1224 length:507 start_codon:yes stop_codon:yes gene_type:complete